MNPQHSAVTYYPVDDELDSMIEKVLGENPIVCSSKRAERRHANRKKKNRRIAFMHAKGVPLPDRLLETGGKREAVESESLGLLHMGMRWFAEGSRPKCYSYWCRRQAARKVRYSSSDVLLDKRSSAFRGIPARITEYGW